MTFLIIENSECVLGGNFLILFYLGLCSSAKRVSCGYNQFAEEAGMFACSI